MSGSTRRAPRRALRTRLTITFAAVVLGATCTVSATTYAVAKQYLIDRRERTAVRQTFLNARVVRDVLQSRNADVQEVLDSTVGEVGTLAMLHIDGEWFTSGVAADPTDLPSSFLEALASGDAAHQRVSRAGTSRLVVGVPLLGGEATYVEVVPMDPLERTLRTLVLSLALGSVVTTAGGALVGLLASRRALQPIRDMSRVAAGITGGDHNARIEVRNDRDLDPLIESFNEMVDSLQERVEREQRFASDVSHELRTPLTTLGTAIEIVQQRSGELPQRSQEAVAMLAGQVSYFQRLVLDLLEISRFDSGVERADLERRDIATFLSGLSAQLGGPEVTNPGGEPIYTGVDHRRMERIVGNLLDNASRYAGGATSLAVRADERTVTITVGDGGHGISDDERTQVFERFWRGRDARHQSSKGSGLGLSLVAEHVRVLGGRVWVEHGSAGGATFVVELPRSEGW